MEIAIQDKNIFVDGWPRNARQKKRRSSFERCGFSTQIVRCIAILICYSNNSFGYKKISAIKLTDVPLQHNRYFRYEILYESALILLKRYPLLSEGSVKEQSLKTAYIFHSNPRSYTETNLVLGKGLSVNSVQLKGSERVILIFPIRDLI